MDREQQQRAMSAKHRRAASLARWLGFGLGGLGFTLLILADRAAAWLRTMGLTTPSLEAFGWSVLTASVSCLLLAWMLPARGHWLRQTVSQVARLDTEGTETWSPDSRSQASVLTTLFPDTTCLPEVPMSATPAPVVPPSTLGASVPNHQWSEALLRILDWKQFNEVCATLFTQAGLRAQAQAGHPCDILDLWLYSTKHAAHEPVSIIRCKQWTDDRGAHQLLRGLAQKKQAERISRATLVTLLDPPLDLVRDAEDHGIRILGAKGLMKLIQQRSPNERAALLQLATRGQYWRPSCVHCGEKMSERVSRHSGLAYWFCPTQHGDNPSTLPVRT